MPVEFRRDIWRQKTRSTCLSYCVVCVILSLAVLTQYRSVCDRRTDRQRTDTSRSIYRAGIASRSNNVVDDSTISIRRERWPRGQFPADTPCTSIALYTCRYHHFAKDDTHGCGILPLEGRAEARYSRNSFGARGRRCT